MGRVRVSIPEPAVSRASLLRGAGVAWAIGAAVLLWRAGILTRGLPGGSAWVWGAAAVLGVAKYRLALRPVARRNVARIRELSPHKDKICLFAFQSLQSYVIMAAMVGAGIALRHAGVPPIVLVAVYVVIGVALALGAGMHFREAGR